MAGRPSKRGTTSTSRTGKKTARSPKPVSKKRELSKKQSSPEPEVKLRKDEEKVFTKGRKGLLKQILKNSRMK